MYHSELNDARSTSTFTHCAYWCYSTLLFHWASEELLNQHSLYKSFPISSHPVRLLPPCMRV